MARPQCYASSRLACSAVAPRAVGGAARGACAEVPRAQGSSPCCQDLLSAAKLIGSLQPSENVAGAGQVHLSGWLIGP